MTEDSEQPKRVPITININIGALQGRFSVQLQRLLDVLRVSMVGLEDQKETPSLPAGVPQVGVPFGSISPAPNHSLPHAETIEKARLWLLKSAFRDAIELLSSLLEEAQVLCAVTSKGTTGSTGEDLNNALGPAARAFHKLSFPDKLKLLKDQYGVETSLDEQTLSANRVRNCLVHRYGRVGHSDVDESGELLLQWRALQFFVVEKGGEVTVLTGPYQTKTEATLNVRSAALQRSFKRGSVVELSSPEMHQIVNSLIFYSTEIVRGVEAHMLHAGFDPPVPRAEAPPK